MRSTITELAGHSNTQIDTAEFHTLNLVAEATAPGSGSGWPISRQSVAASGGRIEIQDLPGKGCIFSVVLPIAAA